MINAPEFFVEFLIYIEGFTITLQDAERALRTPEIARRIPPEKTNFIVGKTRDILDKLKVALGPVTQSSGFDISRSKWVQVQGRCRELRGQLAWHRDSLNAIISSARSSVLMDNHRGPLRFIGDHLDIILQFHDPKLLRYSSQVVEEMDGHAKLVLSQVSTSASPPILEPIPSSSTGSLHDVRPPPTYEDVKANDNYEDIIHDREEKSTSELS